MKLAVAITLALGSLGAGCQGPGAPAAPAFDAGPVGEAATSYAVCPPELDASYTDLLTRVFATSSCGTGTAFNCHSPTGAAPSGAGDLLNLALASSGVDGGLDPAAIYAELLGADGGGQMSANISGDQKILRVVPGDASASMLYVKLTITSTGDPHYGAGMPLSAPGSVCPEALDAVKTWIEHGAKQN